jgi:hypothetical protein
MESQRINILLEKYFDAQTTLEEESELINYFHSDHVNEALKQYIPMFASLREVSTHENQNLGDELMNFIIDSEQSGKLKYRLRTRIITAIAASVILGMLAVNFYSHQRQWKDTYTDPGQAYSEARKALEYVAGKYNKGLAQLEPMGKIENATAPFYSGMKALDKGFKKLESIENLNRKL